MILKSEDKTKVISDKNYQFHLKHAINRTNNKERFQVFLFVCLFVFNGRLFDGTLLNTFCCRHCYLIAKSYLTPCGSMDSSMPGSSVLHYLPEFADIHVH